MKRIILACMIFLFAATSVCANPWRETGSIGVDMTRNEKAKPDTVRITISVETSNKNAKIASDKNKEIAGKVIEAIKQNLNTQTGESIETRGFNVSSRYNYKDGVRTFVNFDVRNTFEVKIKDTAKIGSIIDIAMQNGATRVENLNYTLENKDNVCNDLIEKVTKDAYLRAQSSAKALGLKIYKIKDANVSCSMQGEPVARMYMTKNASLDSAASGMSVPVEESVVEFNATFNGDFFVK